jgi:cell division transport system ATP-binding protein
MFGQGFDGAKTTGRGSRVIDFQKVAYSYGGGELLSEVSLTLAPGSFHFLTGPSGSGKTTLIKLCYMSPDVILADEPTGNVDWEMSQRLMQLLIELNRMGKTILIATHDLNLIRSTKSQVPARVLRIRNRRLQLAGSDL